MIKPRCTSIIGPLNHESETAGVHELTIAFIGAGNMAHSIIGGLLEQGMSAERIRASDPVGASLERLQALAPIQVSPHNSAIIAGADVVILAVKPQVMRQLTSDIKDAVAAANALLVSIAAGITIDSLQAGLGEAAAIVRCMPNTPALLRAGSTALFANRHTSRARRAQAESILAAVGSVHWVEREALLDAVTALSGSGPAYFFLFMEAMARAGVELGLDAALSQTLAIETALGSARMAAQGEDTPAALRQRVTSPGGTTEAALNSFAAAGLTETVSAAMGAAARRAEALARELG